MRISKSLVISFCLNALASGEDELPENRRLIINGKAQSIAEFPYVVSLLVCSLSIDGHAKKSTCHHFCTGTLISPDVVLTAGHCVIDDSTPFNVHQPLTDLSRLRVLLGSSNFEDRPEGARLVKVRDYANAGYNQNYYFPMDNDVGLLFLDSCVSPKVWPMAQISTPAKSLDEGCRKATLAGWGKHKAVPDLLYESNGQINAFEDRIQPYRVCREWYIETHQKKIPRGLRQPVPPKELMNSISPDRHLCHGGDNMGSTCFGDSGGPLLVTDPETGNRVVVGVTSFGTTDTCGGGPSFVSRVSTYTPWIESTIAAKSHCKYPMENIFLTYPLTDRPQSPTDRTGRCGAGKWQCMYSGTCIDVRNVCDGYPQCDDESDEDQKVCKGQDAASNTDSLPPPIELVAAVMGLGIEMESADDEAEGAVASDAMDDGAEDEWDGEVTIEDVVPEGVYLNTRSYSKWREEFEAHLIHYTECPMAFALMEHITQDRCAKEYTAFTGFVKRAGVNPRAVPKYLLDSCDVFSACIGEPGPQLLTAWIKHCDKAPHSAQRPPKWISRDFKSHLKFCDSARSFAELESHRADDAAAFKAQFGHYCPAD